MYSTFEKCPYTSVRPKILQQEKYNTPHSVMSFYKVFPTWQGSSNENTFQYSASISFMNNQQKETPFKGEVESYKIRVFSQLMFSNKI